VQGQNYLPRKPAEVADFSRIRASWPQDVDVRYQAGPNFDLLQAEARDGHYWIDLRLPLEKAADLPFDVPLRYRQPTLLQLGTFADWAEVSSTMAPFYKVDGAVKAIPDLLARVEAIRAQHPSDLERAVAALELVQEDVRYLLNGLDGGNYLPQDVATTWDKKYGDCKAKTVILLAILDHLGIDAEPLLVSSDAGNAVPMSLPIPGAFDHVLVRATIDGQLYYLDGTSMGANVKIVGNVPAFEYGLPIRQAGAVIEPIEQILPRYADVKIEVAADASAGADLPVLATLKMHMVGPAAAQFNSMADKLTDERKRIVARQMSSDMSQIDMEIIAGEDDSEATMVLTGIMRPMFTFDGERGEFVPGNARSEISFAPDRSRRDWREIPVPVGEPSRYDASLRVQLPKVAGEYRLDGNPSLDVEVAGTQLARSFTLKDGLFQFNETVTVRGGEILPAAIAAERRKAAALAQEEFKLILPEGAPRIWRFAQLSDRSQLADLEAAYAKLIAADPDEVGPHLTRAGFRYDTFDFAGSLEDMNKVVELEGNAEYYSQRATVHSMLLDNDAARADLEEAYTLDPSPWRAIALAEKLMDMGDLGGARELLESQNGDEDVQQRLAETLAELDGLEGDPDTGLGRIAELVADDPNNAWLLNSQCWHMGKWKVAIDQGLSVCTKAVEGGDEVSQALDSRALVYLRLGMLDMAYKDIEAALAVAPGQTASVLLRGLIRIAQNDKGGRADIDEALAREPTLREHYRRWGFDL
jgi:tetratricopeptide (TPR) repeat protein